MLPPPASTPFNTISYCVVKISPMFFLFNKSSLNSGFAAENGLWVKVHLPASSFSKKGKSITQQKAKRFGSDLSLRISGLSEISFRFQGIDEDGYIEEYKLALEGPRSQDWINYNEAQDLLAGLPDGDYTFKVKSIDNNNG